MQVSIDVLIIKGLKQGDTDAFKQIYLTYSPRIFNFCRKLLPDVDDATDVVQKTFTTLWEQRSQIDESKDLLKYIYGIARFNAYSAFREHLFHKLSFDRDFENNAHLQANTTDDDTIFNELQNVLTSIIDKLPDKRKEIFKLNRFEGLTYVEIAQKLHISENTVDTQMRKSLDFIKTEYSRFY
jgi:RNA polymerase sigma-70 factor, ECF subfamily